MLNVLGRKRSPLFYFKTIIMQKHPILNFNEAIITGSGSHGIFICSPTAPFDANLLTGPDSGKMGYAVQFTSHTGADVVVDTLTVNGVLGDSTTLIGAWKAGQGFVMEIEKLTVSAGLAIILLKKT